MNKVEEPEVKNHNRMQFEENSEEEEGEDDEGDSDFFSSFSCRSSKSQISSTRLSVSPSNPKERENTERKEMKEKKKGKDIKVVAPTTAVFMVKKGASRWERLAIFVESLVVYFVKAFLPIYRYLLRPVIFRIIYPLKNYTAEFLHSVYSWLHNLVFRPIVSIVNVVGRNLRWAGSNLYSRVAAISSWIYDRALLPVYRGISRSVDGVNCYLISPAFRATRVSAEFSSDLLALVVRVYIGDSLRGMAETILFGATVLLDHAVVPMLRLASRVARWAWPTLVVLPFRVSRQCVSVAGNAAKRGYRGLSNCALWIGNDVAYPLINASGRALRYVGNNRMSSEALRFIGRTLRWTSSSFQRIVSGSYDFAKRPFVYGIDYLARRITSLFKMIRSGSENLVKATGDGVYYLVRKTTSMLVFTASKSCNIIKSLATSMTNGANSAARHIANILRLTWSYTGSPVYNRVLHPLAQGANSLVSFLRQTTYDLVLHPTYEVLRRTASRLVNIADFVGLKLIRPCYRCIAHGTREAVYHLLTRPTRAVLEVFVKPIFTAIKQILEFVFVRVIYRIFAFVAQKSFAPIFWFVFYPCLCIFSKPVTVWQLFGIKFDILPRIWWSFAPYSIRLKANTHYQLYLDNPNNFDIVYLININSEAQGLFLVQPNAGYWVEASSSTQKKFFYPGGNLMIQFVAYKRITKEEKEQQERQKILADMQYASNLKTQNAGRSAPRRGAQTSDIQSHNVNTNEMSVVSKEEEIPLGEKSSQELEGMQIYIDETAIVSQVVYQA